MFRRLFELLSVRPGGDLAARRRSAAAPRRAQPDRVGARLYGHGRHADQLGPTPGGPPPVAAGSGKTARARVVPMPMPRDRRRALILDHREGYISREQRNQILAQIATNAPITSGSGPAREGQALLQGLLPAGAGPGRCTRPTQAQAAGRDARATTATRLRGQTRHNGGVAERQGRGGRQLDEAVFEELFCVFEPARSQRAPARWPTDRHLRSTPAGDLRRASNQPEMQAAIAR